MPIRSKQAREAVVALSGRPITKREEDDFVFAERLEELNEELEALNSEAYELQGQIAKNVAKLLEG